MTQNKLIKFNKSARDKLFSGVKLLSDVVVSTLGPKGRNVAIERTWGTPIVIHDGVTCAKEVASSDPYENVGVQLVRESANKTNSEVGDGTTTATLLAYELIKGGLKLIDDGMNPMVLRSEIYKTLPFLKEKIAKIAKPIKSKEDVERVATISSSDPEIGKLVAEAVNKVGKDGLVVPEEGNSLETTVEYTDGFEFNKGYLLYAGVPIFVTNPDRMEAVVNNPAIIILKKEVSLAIEIGKILEVVALKFKDVVVIGKNITGDALATMAVNKQRGNINTIAIQAPPHDLDNFLDDLAILTGAKVISSNDECTDDLSWLGRADKVIADRDNTVIIKGGGSATHISNRIKALKSMIARETSIFEKEKEEQRLARLTKGVAVIRVGAKTEIDMREKIERVKDAIGSALSARDEGVVAGGGTAFLKLLPVLDEVDVSNEVKDLLKSVLRSVINKLLDNSGESHKNLILKEIMSKGNNYGYEVNSGKIVDLVKEGIIDPAKLIRIALENAVAVSTSLLSTDCVIALDPKQDDTKK